MRRLLYCLAVVVAAAAAAGVPGSSAFAQSEAVRVAIVDVQRILSEATAMKGVESQIEEHQKKFQSEITERERKLRAEAEELQTQRSVLSSEALSQREQRLDQEIADLQRLVDQRRRQLGQARVNAVNKFNETLIAVVEELAEERGYDLVMVKAQVVYVADPIEITQTVLERINQRVPSLKVELPPN